MTNRDEIVDAEIIESNNNVLKNPLEEIVEPSSNSLRQMIVNYVGAKLQPTNNQVNLQMIVSVLADEFPEPIMAVAEENFIRGYKQAMVDSEEHDKTPVDETPLTEMELKDE